MKKVFLVEEQERYEAEGIPVEYAPSVKGIADALVSGGTMWPFDLVACHGGNFEMIEEELLERGYELREVEKENWQAFRISPERKFMIKTEGFIQEIIRLAPFVYDWTMVWGGETSSDYATNGKGTWHLLPTEETRAEAKAYEDEVLTAIGEAEVFKNQALSYLEKGLQFFKNWPESDCLNIENFDLAKGSFMAALEALKAASDLENNYGDNPTFGPLVEFWESLAESLELHEIRVRRGGNWDNDIGTNNCFISYDNAIEWINECAEECWPGIDLEDIEPFPVRG
ncbi:MAG: hypothetical protein RBR08_14550 [Desulforegulaceae bacterium]|nr:hypothetical protein [Desulforegulaceae bacterium]